MKKFIFFLAFIFCNMGVACADYVLSAYDPTMSMEGGYSIGDPAPIAGTLVAISDTYFYYDAKNKVMRVVQTEWVSTGNGFIGDVGAETISANMVYDYSNITIDNMQSELPFMSNAIFAELRAQFGDLLTNGGRAVTEWYKNSVVVNHTKNLFYTNINQIDGRLDNRADKGLSVWANGLYNHSRQSGSYDFSGDTFGVSVGADEYINDKLMLGLGYSFNNTEIDSDIGNLDSDGHNLYLYGTYKNDKHNVDLILNYGTAKYTQSIAYDIWRMTRDFKVKNYGAMIKTGYEFSNNIRPEIGVRYIYISPESSSDSLGGEVAPDASDALTLVAGVKYHYDFDRAVLKTKLNFIYDVIGDDEVINIDLYGNRQRIVADGIDPWGIEAGIAIETKFDKFNVSLEYNLGIRDEYQSHSGVLRARYRFDLSNGVKNRSQSAAGTGNVGTVQYPAVRQYPSQYNQSNVYPARPMYSGNGTGRYYFQ